ncbi:winged helix-turn-helix transcriptional regulator [Lactonifactor longoviformis]|uniref:winged helix-turn-helix transcriptional regulator n=1 Tax=Lactonifactor longoviformis TaxID=341220 RepID=UPI003119C443
MRIIYFSYHRSKSLCPSASNDGFLHREIYRGIPPRVEYTLSEMGNSFVTILNLMMEWSEANVCPDGYHNPYLHNP